MYPEAPQSIPSVVVARPGSPVKAPLQRGDLVVRRKADGSVRSFVVRDNGEESLHRIVDSRGLVRGDTAVLRIDPSETIWPRSGEAQCTFRTLEPRRDGVSDYHFNSFVAFFSAPRGFNPVRATQELLRDFPNVFSQGNRAVAVRTACRNDGLPTVRFTFDAPGPNIHDDWVSMQAGPVSFLARTLERRWYTLAEKALGPISLLPGLGAPAGILGEIAVDINRRHFLAGRRSWRIGRVGNTHDYYVETAAFERYSHLAYLGSSAIIDMRQAIIDVWTIMLSNVLRLNGLRRRNVVPSGHRVARGVAYREQSNASPVALRRVPWIRRSIGRHRGL